MKKYFFFAAAALLALAACSKVNYVEQPDQRITFSVVNYLNSTKATTGVKYEGGPFGTYAWWSPDTWEQSPFNTIYINNAKVVNKNNNTVWSPEAIYYWTKTGKLSFASYSPYKESNAPEYKPATIGENATPEGWYYPNYTINGEDLMFADFVKNLNGNVNSLDDDGIDNDLTDDDDYNNGTAGSADSKFEGVPTLFRHALSQIAFQFNAKAFTEDEVDESGEVTTPGTKPANLDEFLIEVRSAKVYAAKTASYETVIEEGNTVGKWVGHTNNSGEYVYTPSITTTETISVAGAGDDGKPADVDVKALPEEDEAATNGTPFILMPQLMTTTINQTVGGESVTTPSLVLSFDVYIKYNDMDDYVKETLENVVIPLSLAKNGNNPISEWTPNMSVLYTVTINPFAEDPIWFDPAVVDWAQTTTGSIEIK